MVFNLSACMHTFTGSDPRESRIHRSARSRGETGEYVPLLYLTPLLPTILGGSGCEAAPCLCCCAGFTPFEETPLL